MQIKTHSLLLGLLLSILVLVTLGSCKKDPVAPEEELSVFPEASQVIKEMGHGFNLGNTFDYELNSTNFDDLAIIIAVYKNAGMKHVRVPTTWLEGFGGNSLADESGHVKTDHPRLEQLKLVIAYAIDEGLYVVLNAHHERGLKEHYDGTAKYDTVFANLWTDIAIIFAEYDHHLIFEILNEPEGTMGDWNAGANPMSPQALALTRKIMEVGFDAVRATGGNNTQRTIMIATNGQGNHHQIDDVYPDASALPGGGEDKYLAIQVHSYDPWSFCGQDGNNSAYPGDQSIANSLRAVAEHGRTLGVPLNYGEFGVGRNGNQSSRDTDLVRGYYKTFVHTAHDEGMSTTVWDDQGWFGLITPSGNSYQFTYNIVPFMLDGLVYDEE